MADELDKFETQLIAYLDGELSPADAASLEQKLAQYPQHRGLMAELRQQRELLAVLPSQSAPHALKSLLRAKVEQSGTRQLWHRRPYRIAASILLLVGAGLVVHQLLPQRGADAPQYATRVEAPALLDMEGSDQMLARADGRRATRVEVKKGDAISDTAFVQMQQGRQQMFVNSSNIGNGRTIISVASDNPTVLQAEIGRLLRDNRISFSQEAEIPSDEVAAAGTPAPAAAAAPEEAPYAGKAAGPVAANDREGKVAADAYRARTKDGDRFADGKGSQRADAELNEEMGKREAGGSAIAASKQSSAKPTAPAAPFAQTPTNLAATAAAPSATRSGTQAQKTELQKSLTQQVLVARNVTAGDVAQIEQALRDRQVGQKQKLNYRVTETSNSQMPGLAPSTGAISKLGFVTTQPAPTSQGQAKVTGQPAPTRDALQERQAEQVQRQAEQTMDLMIVVEPESK